MKTQKLYKIKNQNGNCYLICSDNLEEAIEKFYNLLKNKEHYEKNIICIEFIDYVYIGE